MPRHKESIFSVIIRRFAGSFVSVFGFIFAFFLFFAFIGFAYKGNAETSAQMLPMKVHFNKEGKVVSFKKTNPTILQINIEGVIGKCKDTMNTSAMIQKIFRQPDLYGLTKGNIKGILLAINSPGGSAAESDEMYQDIMAFKKEHNIPVHVWIGDVCASGGYYLASTGDYISAQTVSVIGSIGVLLNPRFNFYNFMEKIGIEATQLTAGKNKIAFPMFTPMPKNGTSHTDYNNIVNGVYNRFLDIVTEARASHGLTREHLIEYGATIYGSPDAKKLGYIDAANVRYQNAVTHFAKELDLKENSYQVISFLNPMHYLDALKAKLESRFSFLLGDEKKKELPFSLEANLTPSGL